MHSFVQANEYIALRLPSDTIKVLQIVPNTIVSLGKYGTFSSNLIIDRPYNLTYELLDKEADQKDSILRIVPASEIHADIIAEEEEAANPQSRDEVTLGDSSTEFQLVSETGEVIMRTNRETIDDSARQTLSMAEIETLKREGTGAGKEIIAKLMASHLALDQKTSFSLAKYKLLKTRKYMRRFTVLPLDVRMLGDWMTKEKDSGKVLDFREESLALMTSWSNVHFCEAVDDVPGGRWLVVDETGGLVVAALAERMGILHPTIDPSTSGKHEEKEKHPEPQLATSNTLTLVHTNAQPNLSLLKYFAFAPTTITTSPNHPLSTHLHPLSWLQLLTPDLDSTYANIIPPLSPSTLSTIKASKRGNYYRKQRRHKRIQTIVDTTRAGGFDGLIVASQMDPISILRNTIHLLRGGATVTIYSPTIEPLTLLTDAYSTSRRTAFITAPPESFTSLPDAAKAEWKGDDDFPLNPTLLLNSTVQSARVREWQVLPGRTHPLMTGKGGAEGYLFTAVRVVPALGRVEARGKFGKKRGGEEGVEGGREKIARVDDGGGEERIGNGDVENGVMEGVPTTSEADGLKAETKDEMEL